MSLPLRAGARLYPPFYLTPRLSGQLLRKVENLSSARWVPNPFPAAKGRTPAQKKGLAFERAVGKRLGLTPSAQAVKFVDAFGESLAIPDFILLEKKIVVEVKLSFTLSGVDQLELLYLPLLRKLVPGDWRGVLVCKFWKGEPRPLISKLDDAGPGLSFLLGLPH